jgi:endonuclease/exonuclease/phosphatase family metal-dependent hydrolase
MRYNGVAPTVPQQSLDGPPRRRGPRGLAAGLLALGWLITGVLAIVAFLRLVAWDSLEPLIVLNALTLVTYLPAWVVGAVALIARRWWLGGVAVCVVLAQVAFVAPEVMASTSVPAWAGPASSVKVFDANIDSNINLEAGYAQAIKADDPDIISLEEVEPSAVSGEQSLETEGVLKGYPYQCSYPKWGAPGMFVASKLRLTSCQVLTVPWQGQQVQYMIKATLWTPAGQVALRIVHTLAPLPGGYSQEWKSALAGINQSVNASGTGRMLVVGDFNATWNNHGFRALLGDGLTDGAAARGKEFGMTWPFGAIVPAFVRIDHVLTGKQLAVTGLANGSGFESDHKYVTATVAIQSAKTGG